MSSAYIQVNFRQEFFMEEKNITPDQTAYCLQYKLPKNISRREYQTTTVVGLMLAASIWEYEIISIR